MNLLSNLISDQIISAIGWTLVHSLWQGAIVAVMLASLLVILRKTESRIRSLVSIGAMLIFIALTVRTFVDNYNSPQVNVPKNFVVVEEEESTNTVAENQIASNEASIDASLQEYFVESITYLGNYFRQHFSLIVTFWLLGVLMLTLKLLGGFAYTQRLKNYKIFPVSLKWNKKFNQLCEKVDIRRKVKFAESAIVKIPVAIGYLKPVVLLPLGTLTGLPASQVEAILVHELAHIHRADYLINILQSIIETIFFYHPAVWWISSTIRKERENCCDDIAVEVSGDSFTYAKALVNIQAFGSDSPELAMAAIGKKEKLFRRINRMILKQKNPGISGKLSAAAVLLVCIFAATLISCSSLKNDDFSRSHREITHIERLEDFTNYDKGEKTLSFYEHEFGREVHWEVHLDDGEIIEMYKNDRKIPDDELYKYEDKMLRKLRDMSRDFAELEEDLENLDIDLANLDEELAVLKEEMEDLTFDKESHYWDKKRFKEDIKREYRDLGERIRSKIKLDIDNEELRENLRELKEELKDFDIYFDHEYDYDYDYDFEHDLDFDFDFEFDGSDIHIDLGNLHEELEDLRVNLDDMKINVRIPDIPPLPDLSDLKIDMRELNKELKKLEDFLDDLRDEMVDDGLINDVDEDFDLEYHKGSFFVNNNRLTDELNKKYEDLYEYHFDEELEYDSHFHIH